MDELSNLFGGAEQLWLQIKLYASKAGIEATRIVLELYYVLKSPHTPGLDKTIIIAALGYQLLPDDKKILSRDKYGLMGLLDNAATLALAYNRVKSRVTPQIEAQVNAILNQWFGSEQTEICNDNSVSGDSDLDIQTTKIPTEIKDSITTNDSCTNLGGYDDNEDVVIDQFADY